MNTGILDIPEKETVFPVYKNRMGDVKHTPLKYVLPFVFALCFVGGLFNPVILVLLVPCIPLLFSSSWVVIDLNQKRSREYWTLYGFKIGDWKPIVGITAVSVIRTKRVTEHLIGRLNYIMNTVTEEYIYKIKLVNGKDRISWDVMNAEEKEDALAVAKRIAERLDVEVRDYSTPVKGAIKRKR